MYLSICLSVNYLIIFVSIHHLSIYMALCVYIITSVGLSIYMSIYLYRCTFTLHSLHRLPMDFSYSPYKFLTDSVCTCYWMANAIAYMIFIMDSPWMAYRLSPNQLWILYALPSLGLALLPMLCSRSFPMTVYCIADAILYMIFRTGLHMHVQWIPYLIELVTYMKPHA